MHSLHRSFFAICSFSILLTIAYLPISDNVRAVTHDDYEIDVGALTWFDLEDFDEIGDKLTLTVLFKRNPDGTFQERPIDLMIIRTSRLRGTPSIEGLVDLAMYHEQNINRSIRDKVYENKEGSQMSLLFFNDRLPGETGDEKNTTIRIKIDYVVNNVKEEESMNLTSIIVIILVVVAVIGLLALGVFLFKRKIKERYSFFNTSHNGYYVFRDIDESVYYFTPEQYAKMYTANSLVTYKYLGQAARKGGPILGVGQSQNPQLQTFDAQPIAAAPIVGQPLSSGQEIVPDNNPGPPNQMFPEGTVPGSGYGAQVPGIGTQEIPGSISTVPETTGQLPSEEISTSVPQKIGQEGYEMEQPFQSDAAIGQDENVQNQQIPADDGTNSLPVNKEDGILDPQET